LVNLGIEGANEYKVLAMKTIRAEYAPTVSRAILLLEKVPQIQKYDELENTIREASKALAQIPSDYNGITTVRTALTKAADGVAANPHPWHTKMVRELCAKSVPNLRAEVALSSSTSASETPWWKFW
jgi:hypothetical protein